MSYAGGVVDWDYDVVEEAYGDVAGQAFEAARFRVREDLV